MDGALEEVVDHAGETETPPVVGRIDACDACSSQGIALLREDRATAAAEHPDRRSSHLVEQGPQIAEELHVPALVRGHRHRMGVLLHGRLGDLEGRPIMSEVDHLGAS